MYYLLFKYFFIKIHLNMSEHEKKLQIIYDLLNAETKQKKFQNKEFLYGLHQAQILTQLITLYEAF